MTVFVDHYSDLSFVYLMKRITSEETLKAKLAFEAYAKSLGVAVRHYHADNGRFADNAFLKSVSDSGQTISFCGVNAHFQNGRAEKRIRDLQDLARTMLIHAKQRWPTAVEVNLWPYAIRYANTVHNSTSGIDNVSPIEKFAQVEVKPKLKHFHTFAAPVFVLDNKLQANQALQKWESRARIGLYLGPSPRHSRSISLVLNLRTGMVSPQYHVRFDDLFETVRGRQAPLSNWQEVCHFREGMRERHKWWPGRKKKPPVAQPHEISISPLPQVEDVPQDDPDVETQLNPMLAHEGENTRDSQTSQDQEPYRT